MMKQKNKEIESKFLFGKKNYVIMLIGLAFIGLGFILMAGGGSDDPEIFNADIYNFRRIRLAPTLVIIGLGIEIYAIMAKSKK
ncbi:MAG: DUF3098 domain-containing protein [Lutibacter sp.]|nr:DUF3098 domain-containing protein [Lutibacter sp.]